MVERPVSPFEFRQEPRQVPETSTCFCGVDASTGVEESRGAPPTVGPFDGPEGQAINAIAAPTAMPTTKSARTTTATIIPKPDLRPADVAGDDGGAYPPYEGLTTKVGSGGRGGV